MFLYNSTPTVFVEDNVASAEECEHIIKLAENRGLEKNSLIMTTHLSENGELQGEYGKDRGSSGVWVFPKEDDTLDQIVERVSAIANIPSSHAEPVLLQQYNVGEEYKPHIDAFITDEMPRTMKESGNRIATLLLYLNNPVGGVTMFTKLGIGIHPIQGRVLVFGDLDENKNPNWLSEHYGMPPEEGEKWVLSIWYREKIYKG